ncbi:DUF4405 domain-containing protein [Sphingomonas ginkgonis]|uniref:DUF4405 domain-containing protein n=1 Tax=Sphingomonas ginkgonis TaxID=2315330 RepID=A0A3R9WQ09_9SPHN|nr:cytochrome b/b6 domain-containing protein [Sphingomonas ginkgonis]RST30614.1 DUF4405 domain-containing protein [Sphingomonas ginkgonis]
MATSAAELSGSAPPAEPLKGGDTVYRHRLSTRLWHWINAVAITFMLGSGLMIFNAHPRLYWGAAGANADHPWLEIGATRTSGYLRVGRVKLDTTGLLGRSRGFDGQERTYAFPDWAAAPGVYDLAGGRRWHFAFAWLLVIPGLAFWLFSFANGHFRRDLRLTGSELRPANLWHDVKQHARLRFPTGAAARDYNVLQKLSYVALIFVFLPLMVLTGLAMSPGMDAGWPWLLTLLGGRQSARSLHFIVAMAILGFIVVHLLMVLLAGPINEVRSMITGRYKLPEDQR